jgi:hypothetical protein
MDRVMTTICPALDIPLHKAIERVLDDHSAWIARPNDNVTRSIAKLAIIAVHEIISEREALYATPAVGGEEMVSKHLLNERDDFIVSKCLWSEFTASLAQPASPLRGDEKAMRASVLSLRESFSHIDDIKWWCDTFLLKLASPPEQPAAECPLCPGFSTPCGNANCPQLSQPLRR